MYTDDAYAAKRRAILRAKLKDEVSKPKKIECELPAIQIQRRNISEPVHRSNPRGLQPSANGSSNSSVVANIPIERSKDDRPSAPPSG